MVWNGWLESQEEKARALLYGYNTYRFNVKFIPITTTLHIWDACFGASSAPPAIHGAYRVCMSFTYIPPLVCTDIHTYYYYY